MAGKRGSDDGTEAVPVEPTVRPEEDLQPSREEPRSGDHLSPGEPSWPEDPDALRVEAMSEEGLGADAPAASEPEPVTFSAEDTGRDVVEAEDGPVTPGRAGPPWDWDATAAKPASDQSQPLTESVAVTTSDADLPGTPEPMRPSAEHPRVLSASVGDTSAPVPPPRRRGGIGALLLGGMIAAALGFGAAWVARDRLSPANLTLPADLEERLAALEARPASEDIDVQALTDRLADAEARLQALEEVPAPAADPVPPVDLEPLRQEIATGLADAQARAAELDERLAALEARPTAPVVAGTAVEGPGPAVRATAAPAAAINREDVLAAVEPRLGEIETSLSAAREALTGIETTLETLGERVGTNENALATLDQQVAETATALQAVDQRLGEAEAAGTAAVEEARAAAASLAEAQARATEAETQARTGAALTALDAAIDRGEPLGAPLSEIESAGIAVPDTLAQAAAEGLPTLADLREEFPAAARAGLAAAREAGLIDDGGVLGFFRGQLSVRSTAPREGGDPDAVLSRAEAALADGRLDAALREIGTLPEPVRAAMGDWIARAQARADAQAALATLRGAEPDAAAAN